MEEQRSPARGVTVDGPMSQDLDDAIDVQKTGSGWRIQVSIADVSASVPKGSPIDRRAFEMAFTRYLANGNRPMLPRRLADHGLSLLPEQTRKAITFSIVLNQQLEMDEMKIDRTWLVSDRRYSHADVDEILHNTGHDQCAWWRNCFELAQGLLNKRRNEGALAVFDLKKGLITNEDGEVKRMPSGKHYRAYLIVQELMILANHVVTRHLRGCGVPLLFRNHATRAQDVREQYLQALNQLLITPTAEQVAELSAECRHLMKRARYGPALEGHFALNLKEYAHWTSPIRRYADIVNHRMLVAWLDQRPMPYSHDELAAIGDHLNKVSDELRDKKDESFRERRTQRMVSAGKEQLLSLPHGDFRAFIKRLVDGTIPLSDDRTEAVTLRIKQGSATLADIARVLFADVQDPTTWKPIKEAALQWLQIHPAEIFALVQTAHQACGTPELSDLHFKRRREGKHEQRHHVSVSMTLGDRTVTSDTFDGTTRREADQAALVDLIAKTANVLLPAVPPIAKSDNTHSLNPKGVLCGRCNKFNLAPPTFETRESGPSHKRTYHCTATLTFRGRLYSSGDCLANSKKSAEREAASSLLAKMPTHFLEDEPRRAGADVDANPIGALQEFIQKQGSTEPNYKYQRSGPDNAPVFACACRAVVNGKEREWSGVGRTKAIAKKAAAKAACDELFGQS